MRRFVVKITRHPLLNSRVLFTLQCLSQFIEPDIRQTRKNTTINNSTDCITLTLVKSTTPVREELQDDLWKYFWIILYAFFLKYKPETVEEGSCQKFLFFSWDGEIDDCTSGVERFDEFVFVVAGENKPTVTIKRLNVCP